MELIKNICNTGAGGINVFYHQYGLLLDGFNCTGGVCFIPCDNPVNVLYTLTEGTDVEYEVLCDRLEQFDCLECNVQDINPVVQKLLEMLYV